MAVGSFEQKFKMSFKKRKNQKKKQKQKRNDFKHVCIAMSRVVGPDLQNLRMSAIL